MVRLQERKLCPLITDARSVLMIYRNVQVVLPAASLVARLLARVIVNTRTYGSVVDNIEPI